MACYSSNTQLHTLGTPGGSLISLPGSGLSSHLRDPRWVSLQFSHPGEAQALAAQSPDVSRIQAVREKSVSNPSQLCSQQTSNTQPQLQNILLPKPQVFTVCTGDTLKGLIKQPHTGQDSDAIVATPLQPQLPVHFVVSYNGTIGLHQ